MLEIELNSAVNLIDSRLRLLKDLQPLLDGIGEYVSERTEKTFDTLAHGGSFRGVNWPPLSKNYKKRPSGAKVTPSTRLLDDTGRLKQQAINPRIDNRGAITFEVDLDYAKSVAKRRPFLFFEMPQDLNAAAEIAKKFLDME